MRVDDNDVADLTAFSDPHLSGSLAFLMGRNLETPPASIDEAIEAVELVFPAIDISRRPFADSPLSYDDIADADGVSGSVIIGDCGQIGRAARRERVCQYVSDSVVAAPFNKKRT